MFFVARLMRSFPGMSFGDVLALRLDRFWSLYQQIDRLEAQEDLRAFVVARMADADAKTCDDFVNRLRATLGDPVTHDDNHQDGINQLKQIAKSLS